MSGSQHVVRWDPHPQIPENPWCGDFSFTSMNGSVAELLLPYGGELGNVPGNLRIAFSDVLAFRTFWDSDGLSRVDHKRVGWPFLLVQNSEWLASDDFSVSRFIAGHIGKAWQHYWVLTGQRNLDILARGEIIATWIQ